jgi:ABC-2 type transport system permease protein
MADEEEGNELLSNGTVSALIRVEPSQAITVKFKNGGLNETIVKAFLDQYLQTTSLVTKIMVESQGSIQLDDLLAQLATQEENIEHVGFGANNPDSMLSYFYALIGMALIYGGFWGTNELIDLQANLSPKGMRVSIGPTKRLKLLLTNLSAAYTIHLAEILLFLAFLVYGLGISFGDRPLLVVLICAIGSFVGISFGAFTTLLLKKASEGVKVAITTITGIFGGFLSGMMYANIKFWIMTTIPILTFINPVSPIADGLFSLYYFESLDRFYLNLGILLIMLVVFIVGMGLLFRRDDYESI